MLLLRQVIGETLRARRLGQQRTLREVSSAARVSLGYLSEIERGQKEASSELLASICGALGAPLSDVLADARDTFRMDESAGLALLDNIDGIHDIDEIDDISDLDGRPTARLRRNVVAAA